MINAKTRICCVIGNPVSHSLSPQMHNAGYTALGLNFSFVAFQVTDVKHALSGIRSLGIRAVAVTIPHKLEVMKYVDTLDEAAKQIGAVNAIINDNGILRGTNTDWTGAMKTLEEKVKLTGKRVALIGAGGAARAVAYGLVKKNAKVFVFNRTPQKASLLVKELNLAGYFPLEEYERIRDYDIVVNTTSVGMKPNENLSPLPESAFREKQVVFDVVYTPRETKLLHDAKTHHAYPLYGYKMLLYGGMEIFGLATKEKAPKEIMEKTLLAHLSQ